MAQPVSIRAERNSFDRPLGGKSPAVGQFRFDPPFIRLHFILFDTCVVAMKTGKSVCVRRRD
jgi:hypothetical protein